jgi:hypothetical protein
MSVSYMITQDYCCKLYSLMRMGMTAEHLQWLVITNILATHRCQIHQAANKYKLFHEITHTGSEHMFLGSSKNNLGQRRFNEINRTGGYGLKGIVIDLGHPITRRMNRYKTIWTPVTCRRKRRKRRTATSMNETKKAPKKRGRRTAEKNLKMTALGT